MAGLAWVSAGNGPATVTLTTRFAPSPTGPLHLGHAFSAMLAHDMARKAGGRFLLRIEDIDRTRCKQSWEDQIYEDLIWLGLTWDNTPVRQSDRTDVYQNALQQLWAQGLIYPCSCSRRDIAAAATAPQEGGQPLMGPDGTIYPGTCRPSDTAASAAFLPQGCALRLNMTRAMKTPGTVTFREIGAGPQGETGKQSITPQFMIENIGDVVLSRRDFPGSYHLSVVLDDATQQVTHVVRGQDLFSATPIHRLLQILLGLPAPLYHHHNLIRDNSGKRLAKRDDARAISTFRADGLTPSDIRQMTGLKNPGVP